MIITVTERGSFKRCRRSWDFGSFNRKSITPIVMKGALSLGDLVHKTLGDWMIKPNEDVKDICMKYAIQIMDSAKDTYKKQVGADISEEELMPLYDSIQLGLQMVENYATFWKTPLSEEFEFLSSEQTAVVPIPGTEHSLEGTFDAIIRDKSGNLFIYERKTYGARPNLDVLSSNDQFLAYLWILKQLNIGPVGGLAYDGLWKKEVTPKRPIEDLFMRKLLLRPQEELDQFEKLLIYEVNDMANDPPIYINRRWEGCWDCDFEKLCLAMSRGEDWEYVYNTYYTKRIRNKHL